MVTRNWLANSGSDRMQDLPKRATSRNRYPILARRRSRLLLTSLLVAGVVLAGAFAPKVAAASRSVTLSKSSALQNGESIKVSWSGFTPNRRVYIHECRKGTRDWRQCAEVTRSTQNSDAHGNGSADFTVWGSRIPQIISPKEFPNEALDCWGSACAIFVSECPFDLLSSRTASAGVNLTGQGANPSVTTSSSSTTSTTTPAPGPTPVGTLTSSGSSSVQLAMSEWQNRAIQDPLRLDLNHTTLNSPSGISDFVAGTTDFAVSNMAISDADFQALKSEGRSFSYVPIALNGLSVALGMTINSIPVDDLQLSPESIARAFNGKASYWFDSTFTDDNGGCAIPNGEGPRYPQPMIRTDQSATNLVYTGWLHDRTPTEWTRPPDVLLPADDSRLVGRSGSDKLSLLIRDGNPGGSDPESSRINSARAGRLGYVDRSFARKDGIPEVAIKNGAGKYLEPTDDAILEGLKAGTSNADGTNSPDFSSTEPGAYPLWSITYAVVPTKTTSSFDEAKGQNLAKFLEHVTSEEGQQQAQALGFVPLPQELRDRAKAAIAQIPVPKNPNGSNQPNVTNTTPGALDVPGDGNNSFADAASLAGDGGGEEAAAEDGSGELPSGSEGFVSEVPPEASSPGDSMPSSETTSKDTATPDREVNPIGAVLANPLAMLGLPAIFLGGLVALGVGPLLRRQSPGARS